MSAPAPMGATASSSSSSSSSSNSNDAASVDAAQALLDRLQQADMQRLAPSHPLVCALPSSCVRSEDERVQPVDLTSFRVSTLERAAAQREQLQAEGRLTEAAQLQQALLDAVPCLPPELAGIIASYRLSTHPPFLVSPHYGVTHRDSQPFTTLSDSIPALLLSGWVVRQVIGWGALYCNGVQLVYGPSDSTPPDLPSVALQQPDATHHRVHHYHWQRMHDDGAIRQRMAEGQHRGFATSSNEPGTHAAPQRICFTLAVGEYISRVESRIGEWSDSLTLHTSLGRALRIGESGHGHLTAFTAPKGCALVGLVGATGGHVHNLGVVFAPMQPRWKLDDDGDGGGGADEQKQHAAWPLKKRRLVLYYSVVGADGQLLLDQPTLAPAVAQQFVGPQRKDDDEPQTAAAVAADAQDEPSLADAMDDQPANE